jgi:hypothetical protein
MGRQFLLNVKLVEALIPFAIIIIIIIIIITRHFYSALYNNTITLSALHV